MRVAPSVMVEELMREFAVGAGVLGNLSAAYFYGYAGMQIPLASCSIASARAGSSLLPRSAAPAAASCLPPARHADHGHRRPLSNRRRGGFLPGRQHGGCRPVVLAIALCLAVWSCHGNGHGGRRARGKRLCAWRSRPPTGARPISHLGVRRGLHRPFRVAFRTRPLARRGGVGELLANFALVLKHRQTWLVALAGLGTSGPLLGFAGLWGVPFLQAAYGSERTQAAAFTSLLFVGWGSVRHCLAGSPTASAAGDR